MSSGTPAPVYILGAGMHPWGKWGRDFTEYGVVAARAALRDAGLAVSVRRPGAEHPEVRLEQRILASDGNLTPADVMEMALAASGGAGSVRHEAEDAGDVFVGEGADGHGRELEGDADGHRRR